MASAAAAVQPLRARVIAGLPVGQLGLGCMNLSHAYGTPPAPLRAAQLLGRAIELGVTHFDTAPCMASAAMRRCSGRRWRRFAGISNWRANAA